MQQQDPRVMQTQLAGRLGELQTALIQTNNQVVQQQILGEINNIQSQLAQINQMVNAQQQMTPYQQPVQQGYVQQQQGYQPAPQLQQQQQTYNQVPPAGNTFQPANNNQPSFDAMTGNTQQQPNSKYNNRKRNYEVYDTPPVQPNIQQQQQVEQPIEEVNVTPIIGNEYPPLVAPGLTFEKYVIGDKFKYNITGEEAVNKVKLDIDVINNCADEILVNMNVGHDVMTSSVGNYLEAILLNTEKDVIATDIENVYHIVTNKGTDADAYFTLVQDTVNLSHVTDRLKTGKDKYMLYSKLDTILAKELSKYIKHVGGLDGTLHTLTGDYDEFESHVNSITDIETKRRIVRAAEILHKSLLESIDIEKSVKETAMAEPNVLDDYYAVPVIDKTTAIYTADVEIVSTLNKMGDETLAITKTSYEVLFDTLTNVRNSNTVLSRTNKAILMTASGVYEVYYNEYIDYYTILKR